VRYGFVIDQRRCIGCHACTVACKEENRVPLGVFRTWVKYVEKGTFPDTRRYFTVLRCNHCDSAPCVTMCPTVALHRRRDGIVDFDGARCIGCKACLQACPYDALYVDPATQTAAKCHYCAHRVEVGLEPACVIVCPVQAIIPGDLDDPNTAIARLVAGHETQVRKPEQGTRPKLFYLGAEAAALTPHLQARGDRYMFAHAGSVPTPGQPNHPGPAPGRAPGGNGIDLLGLARTVYDAPHAERPWGWKVAAYLWTKSVAAGTLLLAALGTAVGAAGGGPLSTVAAPALGLVFLALTTALLILDLKRPERFHYLFVKPNRRSWLVLGGYILMAFGLVATLWLAFGLLGREGPLWVLAGPMAVLAAGAAGYSAFLFGQAEGRDFWQSPLVLPHLLAAAVLAGAAALLLVSLALGNSPDTARQLRLLLWAALALSGVVLAGELLGAHPTQDATRAARLLTHGRLAGWLWGGAAAGGLALPGLLLLVPVPPLWALAALLALGGLWLREDLWVRAGQSVPLS
jgi:Fe-S-cluster-containing dehydrogenase component/formate-dependent nitrite reductase membrane component NrfD